MTKDDMPQKQETKTSAGTNRVAQVAPHLQGPQPPAPKGAFTVPFMPRVLPVAQNIKILETVSPVKNDAVTE